MKVFVKIVHAIANKIEIISYIATIAMLVVVSGNAIGRQFDLPIPGTYDLACFGLVLIAAPALCRCAVEHGHIELTMLTDKMPEKGRSILQIITDIIAAGLCAVVSYAFWGRVINHINNGLQGSVLKVPIWPFILIEFIVMVIMIFVYIADIFVSIEKIREGGDKK